MRRIDSGGGIVYYIFVDASRERLVAPGYSGDHS